MHSQTLIFISNVVGLPSVVHLYRRKWLNTAQDMNYGKHTNHYV